MTLPPSPTTTGTDEPERTGAGPARHYLTLAFQVSRPDEPARRFALEGFDEIHVGRGPAYAVERTSSSTLDLRLPEPMLSATHLVLRRVGRGFLAEDAGSRNGSRLR